VPLVFSQPGRLAPTRVDVPVGTIDLAPTLCAWCGVAPAATFRGRDLGPSLAGASLSPTPLLAFGNFWGPPLESVREPEWKLIESTMSAGRTLQLFRADEDPRELRDRANSDVDARDRLSSDLALLRRVLAARARVGPPVRPTADERERLRGMGYVGGEDDDGR